MILQNNIFDQLILQWKPRNLFKAKKEAEFNLKKNKSDIRFVILARVISFVITGLYLFLH